MELAGLQKLLDAVSGVRVACVGDVMVDRFVYGEVSRTSPEAPVAVLALGRLLLCSLLPRRESMR
jgi:D-beta-D-heptose 7-phosphate kinase/D-beta-D-heptose 1-phosphate adenosyltransferase